MAEILPYPAARSSILRGFYILKDKKPVLVRDFQAFVEFYEISGNRIVAQQQIGPFYVSTVFIGSVPKLFGGPPDFFETMIFGGALDLMSFRYATWSEAAQGHRQVVRWVHLTHYKPPRKFPRSTLPGFRVPGLPAGRPPLPAALGAVAVRRAPLP